jgi:hypothetical protein
VSNGVPRLLRRLDLHLPRSSACACALVEVDDDHALASSIARIQEETDTFLAGLLGTL